MAVFKVYGVSCVFQHGFTGFGKIGNVQTKVQLAAFGVKVSARCAHTQPITKNINYISNEKRKLKTNQTTLRIEQPLEAPLCVIMSWMAAKSRHLVKYAEVYLARGYDVLTVTCTPLQLLIPTRGSQMIATDLLKFLESNESYNPLVVHGFSVGAYVWAELLVHALKDLKRYQPVLDRVAAQVWDSPADVDELPVGLPLALFPNNKPLQKTLSAYARLHMRMFHNVATRHYLTATHAYHNTPCHAPALFLVSRSDPVGAEKRSRKAHDMMTAAGMKCNWKCWDKSPHVQHFNRHPEEYLGALKSHLQECGLFQTDTSKVQS